MLDPQILNTIVNISVRDIVINHLDNKKFDSNLFYKILYTCIGFSTYFIFTSKFSINQITNQKLSKAFNTCNKFGTMLIVKGFLEKKINKEYLYTVFCTLIGFTVYHIFIEEYLDNFTILEKRLVFFITKDIIVSILKKKPYNIFDFEDSIGISLYNLIVKKIIFFN